MKTCGQCKWFTVYDWTTPTYCAWVHGSFILLPDWIMRSIKNRTLSNHVKSDDVRNCPCFEEKTDD